MTTDLYISPDCLTDEVLLRLWQNLTPEKQAHIAIKALRPAFAEILATDDGLLTSATERSEAIRPSQEGCQDLHEAIEAAFPEILWWYPPDVRYEARDAQGAVLGNVEEIGGSSCECAAEWIYRFVPVHGRPGQKIKGWPGACLPSRIRKAIAGGGWFGVVMPDGRRYPDDFSSLGTIPTRSASSIA